MGHWGVRSYENDTAADALDAALARVHGDLYDDLMDDRNPLSFDQVQQRLVDPLTLAAALAALNPPDMALQDWDDDHRLAYAGVVVRHAEFGIPIPADTLARALDWLEQELIDWDEATLRRLRRTREIETLRRLRDRPSAAADGG